MPSSIHGTIFFSTSLLTCVTVQVPRQAKTNVTSTVSRTCGHETSPAFAYFRTAISVPQVDCILFVPSAICGGSPAHSSARNRDQPTTTRDGVDESGALLQVRRGTGV
jgi:hypothetical protein